MRRRRADGERFFIDITDKHQAETKLESLINTIPDSLIRLLIGKKNMVRYVNKEFIVRRAGSLRSFLPEAHSLNFTRSFTRMTVRW